MIPLTMNPRQYVMSMWHQTHQLVKFSDHCLVSTEERLLKELISSDRRDRMQHFGRKETNQVQTVNHAMKYLRVLLEAVMKRVENVLQLRRKGSAY